MIGSHNTFSYLPPKRWWMKLLTPWHKCQQWQAFKQIQLANVDYLDIRVRFDKNNKPVLVHNNVIYKTPYKGILNYIVDQISTCNLKKPIPCRLMLDERKKPEYNIEVNKQILLFMDLIDRCQDKVVKKYITIDDARIYWDWQHPFIKSKYNIKEIHTSVCSPLYKYILGTKWFAQKNNIQLTENQKCDKKVVYLIDYVNIQ